MRSVGLDLGARHIAFCEVVAGAVVRRGSVRRLTELMPVLGPDAPPARVAFEACREGWHVHDVLTSWHNEALMLDTTRIKQIGVGQHGKKNDDEDAKAIAMAVDAGRLPVAHVLSVARRELRSKLSVRGELVEMRARQIVTIRGLARAKGVLLRTCATENFVKHVEHAKLDEATQALIAPLLATLRIADVELVRIDTELAAIAKADSVIRLLATAPGVGVIVAATFVSVIDEAKRFSDGHAVSSYLGLVPSERTTGGPNKRRLGSITKQGNSHARAMLVQAAWLILRSQDHNNPLRRWGTEIANRRGRKIAAIALARKLAGLLWAMWRDGTVFDADFAGRETAKGYRRDAQRRALVADAMARATRKIQRHEGAEKRSSRKRTRAKSSTEAAV